MQKPEVRVCLVCLGSSQEASVARAGYEGSLLGGEVIEEVAGLLRAVNVFERILAFTLSETESY